MRLDSDGREARCDGCGKKGTTKEIIRGAIGREEGGNIRAPGFHKSFDYDSTTALACLKELIRAPGFHKSFDYCDDNQGCFAKAALAAAKDYKKLFKL